MSFISVAFQTLETLKLNGNSVGVMEINHLMKVLQDNQVIIFFYFIAPAMQFLILHTDAHRFDC